MMLSLNSRPRVMFLAGVVSMLLLGMGLAQEEVLFVGSGTLQDEAASAPPEKARALLDELKKSELDRQIAVKQTEIDRIKQDQAQAERDAASLQKTIDSTAALITDSNDEINKLTTESRRLEHELALAEVRAGAERLKIDGLRALSVAQSKSLSALARHAEEAEARTRLRAAELALLQEGKPIPAEGRDEAAQGEIGKTRKALALAEAKTVIEDRAAHDAMKDATAKMALAEAKETLAKRLADNDLTLPPIADKPKAKSTDKPAKKESDPPVRKPQPAIAASTPSPAPKAVAGAHPTNAAPRGPFFGR